MATPTSRRNLLVPIALRNSALPQWYIEIVDISVGTVD